MTQEHLAYEFAVALRNPEVRVMLAQRGFFTKLMTTVVAAGTVVDEDVLRATDAQVVRQAPETEVGWEVLPVAA